MQSQVMGMVMVMVMVMAMAMDVVVVVVVCGNIVSSVVVPVYSIVRCRPFCGECVATAVLLVPLLPTVTDPARDSCTVSSPPTPTWTGALGTARA